MLPKQLESVSTVEPPEIALMSNDVRVHCRYDNELQQALQRAGGTSGSGKARKQVVVLGAGMDTRA